MLVLAFHTLPLLHLPSSRTNPLHPPAPNLQPRGDKSYMEATTLTARTKDPEGVPLSSFSNTIT